MSTRKKKAVEKVDPPTDPASRISIDPQLMGRFRRVGKSALDLELEAEDTMLARDLKEMRVEELNLKRKTRMAKLQKEIDKLEKETENNNPDSSDVPRMSVAMAQQISQLPEDERNKVIETYAMFRSIDQSKGKGDSLLPLLIGFSKSNTGSSQSDMATYAKAMSDQFKTGIDVMQSVIPKEKPSNATELLKIFRDLVSDSVKKPMEELAKNMQAQPSAFEQILMNPEMFARAKEIGMFGSREPRAGGTNIDLQIEQMRGERELSIKKMDLEWRKAMLEIDAKDRRSDNIMQALAPLSALLATPVAQRMQTLGQQQGAAHVPTNRSPPPVQTQGTTILLQCPCGNQETMSFPGPPPETVNCPKCGQLLVVGDPTDVPR